MRTVGYKVPRKTEDGKQENQPPASFEQSNEKSAREKSKSADKSKGIPPTEE